MKKLATLRAVGLALLAALITVASVLAAVQTDKYDYAPGETVQITGDGMAAGETVAVEVFYPDGSLAQRHEVTADAEGRFSDSYVLPSAEAPVTGTYTVMATGLMSGTKFTATFTDAININSFAADCNGASDSFTTGATVCAKATGLGKNASGKIEWWAPGASSATRSTSYSGVNGNTSDSFAPSSCGTWTLKVYQPESTFQDDDMFEVTGCVTPTPTPIPTGSIQVYKYNDLNADGDMDGGEPFLSGWQMTVFDSGDSQVAQGNTGASGYVTFSGLAPDSYTVKETLQTGPPPWFNTDPGPLCLPSSCPNPSKGATVTAGSTTSVYFGNIQSAEKHGQKFYDLNTNGVKDAAEVGIAGWKVNLTGTAVNGAVVNQTQFTDASGNYAFTGLLPGSYIVTELIPPGSTYLNTTPLSIAFTLTPGEVETGNDFGNVCLGPGGGKTLGFWSNKNGQAQVNDGGTMVPELALLASLNLRNADGTDFDPAAYPPFRKWLLEANGYNMAYMLSAQLAAMELNVEAGFVDGSALIYAPGTTSANAAGFATVNAVMAEANTELGLYGITIDGGTGTEFRPYQTALKNALWNATQNVNFVQPTPCAFTTPY